jgi:hypothetical protein
MSDPKESRIPRQTKLDPDTLWYAECPNCHLLKVVLIEATTERHGQVFTYERQECLSCGWPDDMQDPDPDE